MLKEAGMAALNLEFTDRVYRTEYSVFGHSALLKAVTGMDPAAAGAETARAFARAWDICLHWSTDIGGEWLGDTRSSMGHAVYAEGGSDRDDNVHYVFADEDEVFAFDPKSALPDYPTEYITGHFNRRYAESCSRQPDGVNMTGIYITCMSGLIEMLGWNMLLTCAGVDPKRFGDFTARYSRWIEKFFIALARSDAPVVMIHDDIVWTEGAFISPEWYRSYIFPAYKRCFRHLIDSGKKILYTSDGNYTGFIDDIAACGVNGFVLEPLTDMEYIARKYGRTHSFIGNADTRVLLYGGRDDICREVKRCMDIGKKCPGFIMAVGNHIPPNTPVESCLWYDEFCKKLGKR